jgi:hypothetical protein
MERPGRGFLGSEKIPIGLAGTDVVMPMKGVGCTPSPRPSAYRGDLRTSPGSSFVIVAFLFEGVH